MKNLTNSLITVIITSFNHANFIRETIESVINQTYKNIEIIIWDDASTDNSWEIIEEFALQDQRIKKFRNEKNYRGVYGINKSIFEISSGDFIAIHHSDDIWALDKLEKQIGFLNEFPEIGAVFTNAQAINEKGEILKEGHIYESIFDKDNRTRFDWLRYFFFFGNALCHPSVLIRKECYLKCGGYKYALGQLGDFEMWTRLCLHFEIFVIQEKLVKFRILNNNANTSAQRIDSSLRLNIESALVLENYRNIKEYKDFIRIFPEAIDFNSKFIEFDVDYFLANICLKYTSKKSYSFFALKILFDFLNSGKNSNLLLNTEFIKASGSLDVFSEVKLNELLEEIKNLKDKYALLENEISQKKYELNNLNKIFEDDIFKYSKILSEKDSEIAEFHKEISLKDERIRSYANSVNEIYQSKSWRITSFVRYLGANWSSFKKAYSIINKIFIHNSLANIYKKTIFIINNQGLKGLLNKLRINNSKNIVINDLEQNFLSTDLNLKERNWLNELRGIDISKYDVISFDVFDTAIIRTFIEPTDVFKFIEKSGVNSFYQERLNLEIKARNKFRKNKDISYDSIYEGSEFSKDIELKYEFDFCRANPIIYDLYSRAKILKKKVIFTSDMYLSKDFIRSLLINCGYDDNDEIYVSSEDDLIKGDGSRFNQLKKIYSEEKIFHIGDNFHSDFISPGNLGLCSFNFHTTNDFFENDSLTSRLYKPLVDLGNVSHSFLLGIYRYWKYSNRDNSSSIWRDIGFLFGGPLIFSFAKNINIKSQEKNVEEIFFLARDGDIIKKVFEALYESDVVKSSYILASRRALTFQFFSQDVNSWKSCKYLKIYTLIEAGNSAEDIFNRLGYEDLDEIKNDLIKVFNLKNIDSNDIFEVFVKNKKILQELAEVEFDSICRYMIEKGVFEKKSLMIDVGWNGSIQDSINLIAKKFGYSPDINGYYIGVRPDAFLIAKKEGFLFDSLNKNNFNNASNFFDFIELLTSSPNKGLVKFRKEEPLFDFEVASDEELRRIKISKDIQRGIMEFAILMKKNREIEIFDSVDLMELFELFRKYPSEKVKKEFSSVKHSRMPGASFLHKVINFED